MAEWDAYHKRTQQQNDDENKRVIGILSHRAFAQASQIRAARGRSPVGIMVSNSYSTNTFAAAQKSHLPRCRTAGRAARCSKVISFSLRAASSFPRIV